MELDECKHLWENVPTPPHKEPLIHPKQLPAMNKPLYLRNLKKIIWPEILGSGICLASALYILYHFPKLDTVYLQAIGAVSMGLLLLLPGISLWSVYILNRTGTMQHSYAETVKEFSADKRQFLRLQRLNMFLCYVLLVLVIVLISRFFYSKDITGSTYFWIFSFSLGYIFLSFYSRWVSRFYHHNLQQAEELLRELPD